MANKEMFIKMVENLLDTIEKEGLKVALEEKDYDEAMTYFTKLKEKKEKIVTDKPLLTENGKAIITHLKTAEVKAYFSKEIADATGLSGRSVAGSMRKLITDGFVLKEDGEGANVYTITEGGLALVI
jgi:DNA-binding MarR family transcriptional regulator